MPLGQNDCRMLADFALEALRFGLIEPRSVIAWADGLIAELESPANWILELSLVDPSDTHEVLVRLRRVPGESDPLKSHDLLSALVLREWKRGRLDIDQVLGIGWELYVRNRETLDSSNWGVVLDRCVDEFDNDLISEAELREAIDHELARLEEHIVQLPQWVWICWLG